MSRPALVCDYPSALDWLMTQINYERTMAVPYETAAFKLDRMRRLLALVGDPHLGLRAIHIAGTKGKGSTAAMLASVLQAAGLRTGLYTSPHLTAIEERIAIGGCPIERDEFALLASELQEAVACLPADAATGQPAEPTFFEITTAMAFLHFARQRVEAAVLEVGLGGRLDSTNVCHPSVSIITSISFDHTRQLGNTLAAIAGEKAGIIKPGVPVISGVTIAEPRAVIGKIARQCGAPLYELGEAFDFEDRSSRGQLEGTEQLDYREPAANPVWTLPDVQLGLLGRHQAANAATAIAATCRLREQGWSISEAALRAGLASVHWPARIEVTGQRPTVILDVAHNVASIAALLAVLRERFAPRRRILIFASSKDKDTAGMLRLLLPQFDEIVLTRYVENPRAVEPQSLHELATAELSSLAAAAGGNDGGPRHRPTLLSAAAPREAWELARQSAGPEDLVCITGSFFLAAELRPLAGATTLETPRHALREKDL